MGCSGSKQGVAATGTSISYRRLLRTRSRAANSDVEGHAAFADVAGKASAPAPATAIAGGGAVSDVKAIFMNVDVVRMAADGEGGVGNPREPEDTPCRHLTARTDAEGGGGACTGDARAGPPPEAKGNEEGGGSVGDGRALVGSVQRPGEEQKTMRSSTPSKICDVYHAPKPGTIHGHEPRDQEDNSSQKGDAQMENLRRELQQVAEQIAGFGISPPEDDDEGDSEKYVMEKETHEEEGSNSHAEQDAEIIKEPVFEEEEEEDQFGDAPEVFKEDFSNKIPVYDEYPLDLPQASSISCDLSTEGNAIASYLSLVKGGIDKDQIGQVLYQRLRRSKLHGSEGKKRRTHYQLHHKQIRKHRKRRTYKLECGEGARSITASP